ncbi:MAG: hypothetical protein M1829_003195 [Trizodia sp. TS-e1964]|nr:MAG: hypothetical protein M1829_003195 [Trizodia sp. TS-e1964]
MFNSSYSPTTAPSRKHYAPISRPPGPLEMDSFDNPPWEYQDPDRSRQPAATPMTHFSPVLRPQSSSPSLKSGIRPQPSPSSPPASAWKLPRKSLGEVSIRSNASRYRGDNSVEDLVNMRSKQTAEWRIHWYMPSAMVVLFVLGVVGALSHHFFYKSLDGHPAVNQLTMLRYGTAFAFFTKAMLVGSVELSYRQQLWYTFRRKAMTLATIDALFAAIEDPTCFFISDMSLRATLATIMAAATWLIPIAAVLSPAALTTNIELLVNSTVCPSVPILNFTRESEYNFRDPVQFDDYPGYSLAFVNTTDLRAGPGYFDYYDQPSKTAKRLAILSVYSQKAVPGNTAAADSCQSAGWNCTYSISFRGPGYKCDEMARGIGAQSRGAPFNTSVLAPEGKLIYNAVVDTGDYADPQLPTGDDGQPLQTLPPWPDSLGVFLTEPELWIGHSILTNNPLPSSSPFAKRWKFEMIPVVFKCTHYEVDYTIFVNFTEGIQYFTVTERKWLAPIVNTTINYNDPSNTTSFTINNPSGAVRPDTSPEIYKKTTAYHALGSLMRNFLRGSIQQENQTTYPLTRTDASETKLISQNDSVPVSNLMNQTETVYEEMLLTLLSDPHLILADNASVPCTRTRFANIYDYRQESLWIGYAIVVFVTALCGGVGMAAIRSNGISSDTSFSRIMVTTRNATLDQLSVGACLGGDPFPKALTQVRLRFGVLREDDGEEAEESGSARGVLYGARVQHCAFGTEAETRDVVKGGLYAGLRAYRDEGEEEKQCLIRRGYERDEEA